MDRRTGIPLLRDVPWGTHLCVFYETPNDLLDTACAFFRAGLQANELCIWAIPSAIGRRAATTSLRRGIPHFDRHLAAGRIELLSERGSYMPEDRVALAKVAASWLERLGLALDRGFDGLRLSGNAFWMNTGLWDDFLQYELEVDRLLEGRRMVAMCTYSLRTARAADVLDVMRSHQVTVARRKGDWEFLEAPGRQARKGGGTGGAHRFPGREFLTERELATLSEIVRGATSKQAGRALGISPRTVEFHRENIMRKLRVKNIAELISKVLGAD